MLGTVYRHWDVSEMNRLNSVETSLELSFKTSKQESLYDVHCGYLCEQHKRLLASDFRLKEEVRPIGVQCLKAFTQNFQAEICLKLAFSTQVRSALLTFGAIIATRISVTFRCVSFQAGCVQATVSL